MPRGRLDLGRRRRASQGRPSLGERACKCVAGLGKTLIALSPARNPPYTQRQCRGEWKGEMTSIRIDPDTKEAVRRFLQRVADQYDVVGAILYGSRARGTHRPDSDADVAVLLEGEHEKVLKVTLAMSDVAYDVLLETGINISPLPVWLDEWRLPETSSTPALLHNIARDGVRL